MSRRTAFRRRYWRAYDRVRENLRRLQKELTDAGVESEREQVERLARERSEDHTRGPR